MSQAPGRASAEIAFCEQVLAKGGLTVLTETLRDAENIETWSHYPKPDVFDPQTGAQWYYHCHPAEPGSVPVEHGHFHCFLRPQGADGPIHHLIAIGVTAYGKPVRLFTVNQWVVGDDWLTAEATVALLERFDVHMPRPSYLVNRWLTAMITAHQETIAALIRERDQALARHVPSTEISTYEDRTLEVTSQYWFPDAKLEG